MTSSKDAELLEAERTNKRNQIRFADGREVSYTYGKAGERTSITYPDGRTIHYGFDENLRLSELKDGDRIISYAYDKAGRLAEKKFPNGMRSSYRYDWKGQITELRHEDKEGVLDRYLYQYDLLGNKTGVIKERRGLQEESGAYSYGYDAIGRLESVTKDGNPLRRYGYDAFGNRTALSEKGQETAYTYNALNQLKESLNPLNQLKTMEPEPEKTIRYTIDLTRGYHNLLEKEENQRSQIYLWDGNAAGFYDKGAESPQYYLQDELGSPLRIEGEDGSLRESYGYDEFGCDLYQNQGRLQPFGYTGYQHDRVAGTYFAQAREYHVAIGRFCEQDIIKGSIVYPISLNNYLYCRNNPCKYVDKNGKWITVAIGAGIGFLVSGVGSVVSQVASGKKISEVNWKDIGVDALSGAITGGIAGTGIGALQLLGTGAGVGAVNYLAKTSLNGEWESKSIGQHLFEGALSVAEWSLATWAGGSISPTKTNGLMGELKFAKTMLKESARGIPAQRFYQQVKKDIIKELGKTSWETFYTSFIRTGIVGSADVLYNVFVKEDILKIMDMEEMCPIKQ